MQGALDRKLILVVEDDRNLLAALRYNLVAEGYEVATAANGSEALNLTRERRPDLILLDLMLPVMSGVEVCRTLRRTGDISPIIMLTARDGENERVQGLNVGADDYVTKPFSTRELIARIGAHLRRVEISRTRSSEQERHIIRADGLEIDPAGRTVRLDGTPLDLRPKEFDLLHYIASRPGRVVTRDQLLREVWGYRYSDEFPAEGRTVDVHVRWLRTKIEMDSSKPRRIETVRGVGYRFAANFSRNSQTGESDRELLAG